MTRHVLITFFISENDVISLESLEFSYNYTRVKHAYSLRPQTYFRPSPTRALNQFRNSIVEFDTKSTVDKFKQEVKKLQPVNPFSCRINLLISCLVSKQARRNTDVKSVLVLNEKYRDEIILACMTSFKMAGKMAAIHHFRTDHNSPCLPPKFCKTILSNFSQVLQSSREKSKTMIMKIWGC